MSGRQPESQGRLRPPAAGACADAHRARRLFPTLTAVPRDSRPQSINRPPTTAGKPATDNDFTLDADLSYEFDLFGRIRNTVAAARASEQASAGDLATLDLSTHAELASDYFTLRGARRSSSCSIARSRITPAPRS